MVIVPVTQKEANFFVKKHHRHHKEVTGSIFQMAAQEKEDGKDKIVGVAIIGRVLAYEWDRGYTAEVNRLCTDGTKNACSFLYSAAWRVAKQLGYKSLITYILETEPGVTLRAAGWKLIGEAGGGSWNSPSRPRDDNHPTCRKLLYEICVSEFTVRNKIKRIRVPPNHYFVNMKQLSLFQTSKQ